MDQPTFLANVEASWEQLLSSIENVPPVIREVPPNPSEAWSVKDVLAHISFWDDVAIHKLQGTARPYADQDVDAANDIEFRRSRDRTWDDVWAEFNTKHSELLEALNAPIAVELNEISEDTWEHYDEHRQWLDAWLEPMIR